jgi:hypothetical protein
MIEVENKYDFTVDELTDILNNTPIRVDHDTNEVVANYIIQALNINRIIKEQKRERICKDPVVLGNPTVEISRIVDRGSPYHLILTRNENNQKVFECDARTVAFYAYDPMLGKPHKGILSEKKPTPTDIANICEFMGDINGWGDFQ